MTFPTISTMHAVAVLFASALLASSAGAAVSSGGAPSPSDTGRSQGRACPIATTPARLPDIATLLDVDAFLLALAAEPIDTAAADRMVFSIRFSPNGEREWVQALGDPGDAAQRARLQRLIAAHLKQQTAATEPWALRLQIRPGDSAQLSLAHSEVCPVEIIPGRATNAGGSLGLLDREEMEELRRARPVEVTVEVSPTGQVLAAELRRRSGSRILDDEALNRARDSKYRPALVDGFPVTGRFVLGSRTRVRSVRLQ